MSCTVARGQCCMQKITGVRFILGFLIRAYSTSGIMVFYIMFRILVIWF